MIASFLEDESAAAHCDESLALFRELDDSTGLAVALTGRALIARKAGDLQTARALYEEVLRVVGPGGGAAAAGALQGLGWLSFWEGREDEAAALFADSLAKFEEAGDRLQAAGSLYALGQLASRSGDHERAHASCEAALAIAEDLDDRLLSSVCLRGAGPGCRRGRSTGARGEAPERRGSSPAGRRHPWTQPRLRDDYEQSLAEARSTLGDDAFAAAWEAGQSLTLEQAGAVGRGSPGPPSPAFRGLTPRELEVPSASSRRGSPTHRSPSDWF